MKINLKNILIIFAVFILMVNQAYSQFGSVSVHLRPPPPYKFALEDMWKVTLTNTSKTTFSVYLYGTASRTGVGEIVQGTTKKFSLPPGTKVVMPIDISPIDVKEPNKDYENVIKQTGTVPNGDYEICIQVFDASSGLLLGAECNDFSVQTVSQTNLVSPQDESSLSDMIPVFSWLPPSPVRSTQNLRYTLSIVEIMGIQSAYDAMESNPELHQKNNIVGTVYQYPPDSKFFKPGKKYAWQVTSYLDGFFLCKSDVWEFDYIDNTQQVEQILKNSPIHPLGNPRPYRSMGTESIYALHLYNGRNENNEAASFNPFIQKKPAGLFLFSGTSELYGEAADRSATNSNEPQRFADWNINPTLSIKGIPFGLNFLLTTKENQTKDKQNINSTSMIFDPSKLKDIVDEKVKNFIESKKEEIEQKVKEKGEQYRDKIESDMKNSYTKNLALPLKIFSMVNNLGVGVTYPSYSKYTLSGIPVTGANIEINPGIIYAAFAGFKSKKPVENTTFKRNLFAGKIGVGKKDNTHLFFSLLYAKDDENSIRVADTNSLLKPAANYVLGTDGKVTFLKSRLSVEGEVAVSMFTSDVTAPDIISSSIPAILKNLFHPKNTSSFDGYYAGNISFDNPKSSTKTAFKVMMIGPGYRSLGSSSTMKDILRFEFQFNQKLINNKISASLKVTNDRDNLIAILKPYRSTTTSGVLNLSFSFPKAPRVIILYTPSFASNNSANDTDKADNKINCLTLISTYQYKIADFNATTQINAGLTDNSTYKARNNGYSRNASLSETISFKIPLSISGRVGFMQTMDATLGYSRLLLSEITSSYSLFKFWTATMGLNIEVTKQQNKRSGFSLDNYFNMGKNINLDIRVEKNNYNDWINGANNFNEFVFKSTISTNW